MRTGLVLEKVGMSSLFTDAGERIGVTLLKMEACQVVSQRTEARDGYTAVVLGYGDVKLNRVHKPVKQFYAKANLPVKRLQKEFRVTESNLCTIGDELNVSHFQVGQFVDVAGATIGKGFAGGMKRHGFRGLEASHGVSVSHRSHGSTGGRQDPGRVFKNKKMAGHMGTTRITVQNLEVLRVDDEQRLLIVKGGVPGSKGTLLVVKDAVKK